MCNKEELRVKKLSWIWSSGKLFFFFVYVTKLLKSFYIDVLLIDTWEMLKCLLGVFNYFLFLYFLWCKQKYTICKEGLLRIGYDSLMINKNLSYRSNPKTCTIFKQVYFSSTVSDCCKYLKWFPLVSKFIATNTYRSYLTTYNNRLKWYLKTDLNTLEAQDDTIIMVDIKWCCVVY